MLDLSKDYPFTRDCKELSRQIERLIIGKDYYAKKFNYVEVKNHEKYLVAKRKWFNQSGCEVFLSESKFQTTQEIIESTNANARAKIDAETEKQIKSKKMIAFGALGFALLLLILLKRK